MAVKYKAPIKDIIFGLDVIDSYNVLNRVDRFKDFNKEVSLPVICLLYTSPSPRD